jgi:hypothetical protein
MRSRRVTLTLLMSVGLISLSLASALAATPAFDFEVGVHGLTIRVVVDFEPVPVGFAWPQLEASGVPEELVGLFPADRVDDRGRPLVDAEPILLSLDRTDVGVYEDSVTLPEGRWAVVAWPLLPDFDPEANPGAARTEFVTIGGPPAWVWLGMGAIVGIVVAGLSVGLKTPATGSNRKHDRRNPRTPDPG